MPNSVILIHAQPHAPSKPPEGAACNGCGLCCLAEPCPAGMIVSRRSGGACKALRWDEPGRRYRCGLVEAPTEVLRLGNGFAGRMLGRLVARLARRWISAGTGCDASFGVVGNVAAPTTVQGLDPPGFAGAADHGRPGLPSPAASAWGALPVAPVPARKRRSRRAPATT